VKEAPPGAGDSLAPRLKRERARLGKSQEEMARAAGIPLDTYKKYEGGSRTPGGDALAGLDRAGVDVLLVLTGRELMKGELPKVEQPPAAYTVTATEAGRVVASLKRELGHDPGGDWTGLLIILMADHGLKPSGVREVLQHLSTFRPAARDSAA